MFSRICRVLSWSSLCPDTNSARRRRRRGYQDGGRSTRRGTPGQLSPSYDPRHTASSLRASVLNSLAAASIAALALGASIMPAIRAL
jgi:hypothetical protein